MTEEMPTLPHDQEPIDDMPTEVHDDWPGGETRPPEHAHKNGPDELSAEETLPAEGELEPVEVEIDPIADMIENEPIDDELEPVNDELEPVEEMQTLEHEDWVGEEDETDDVGLNPRVLAMAIGGGAVVLIGLVLAALFLPPLYLAATLRGCQALDTNNPSLLRDDGLTATWVGPDSVRLCVNSIAQQDFQDGLGGSQFEGALDALPPYLQLQSPVYTVEKIGDSGTVLEIALPPDAQPYTDLDLYRWDTKNKAWVFVPGHIDASAGLITTDETPDSVALFRAAAITPLMGATLDTGDAFDPNVGPAMNLVMPSGITLGPDNSLSGSVAGGWALGAGYAVVPVVRATDPASLSVLLNSPADVALHISDLKSFVVGDGYNGVAVDYQGVSLADSEAFGQFIADLADALHEYNKQLVVVLPPPTATAGGYDTAGYDWRAIGAAADAVVVTPGNNPDDYAVSGSVTSLLSWATGEMSRLKIYLSFPTRSAQDVGGMLSLISYDEALSPLGKTTLLSAPEGGKDSFKPGASLDFNLDGNVSDMTADQNTGAFYYTVAGDQGSRKVWIVTAATIRARLDMASAQHIGGMILTGLMSPGNDGGLPIVINEFKTSQASTVPSGLSVAWTVIGSAGAVLNQMTGLGTPLAWKAGQAGDYKVDAAIVGGKAVDRGEIGVKIAAAATTPAPTKPVYVTAAPGGAATAAPPAATTEAPPPPPPVASGGGGGGAIELGGQVPGGIGHGAQMQQAGMKWVKFQAKFGSIDAGGAAGYVAAGKAAGFKVLISTPGQPNPSSINYGGYLSYISAVAAAQPEAIEIWNEMNIINEWPQGQIDPNAYVSQMLAPAFNAIKSVSPNTMVIIGALAPTGCDDGVNCWSDQRYAQGLAAAGAAQYADCMGAHANSGTTPPDASTGHPSDDGGHHYSWYFLPTINVTHNAIPQLPICITEYGYLSPEGYGALSDYFQWGANTKVSDQAAWLAQGYQLAQGLGFVRLVIVWNVDFTYWGFDPQAGYAIVRPDGSCPACATLGAVAN